MTLYTFPNGTTPDQILTQTATAVPGLAPLVLLFIFGSVFLGGSRAQKSRSGIADYAAWSVVASMSTLIIAAIMSVIPGLISLSWLIIMVVITIFAGVWLFIDRKLSEGF